MRQKAENIPELDKKGLRQFGLVTGVIIAGLFGLLLPFILGMPYPVWPWIAAAILVAWALLAPRTLKLVHRYWMRFGMIMNRITMPLILGVVFFLVIVPVALIMKLLKHDPMSRRLDNHSTSFRVNSRKASKRNMEQPF